MTKALKPGTVGVNGYQLEPNSPFGGYRQSGQGPGTVS
jgi:aldehyde dehydrogenase (NAD+)